MSNLSISSDVNKSPEIQKKNKEIKLTMMSAVQQRWQWLPNETQTILIGHIQFCYNFYYHINFSKIYFKQQQNIDEKNILIPNKKKNIG